MFNLKKYKESPQKQATLCFLIKDDQILLAMKKRGFGKGNWNGVGGKPEAKEDLVSTAIREAQEEISVIPKKLEEMAVLDFYFIHKPDWNQQVVAYFSREWEGEPQESEEMAPKWYKKDQLPLDSMWCSDIHWLVPILEGKKVKAKFIFKNPSEVLKYKVEEIS